MRPRAERRRRAGGPLWRWAAAALALATLSPAHGQAIQDSRCYLMNGGAVESFFISEDTPVGSVIGVLSVNGDPREAEGDITLSLQERGAALGVARGSKNLTLLRALDREERLGPSNVYVNVRCDRRRTSDPSFIIPVSVRVWDVNDNAPVWAGAPYAVRLSELTAPGARVLQAVRATDHDQPGPHATIHYSVLPGPHSELIGFQNELDSTLVVKKQLDFETLPQFTLTLRAADEGVPPKYNDTTLVVEVVDADDQNPKFLYDHYTAVLPDNASEGMELETSPARVSAVDQDSGINAPLYYSLAGGAGGASGTGEAGEGGRLLTVERDSGRLRVAPALLRADLPATVVIKATQYDNADRYALATLTISRAASPGAAAGAGGGAGAVAGAGATRRLRFSQRAYSAAVSEHARVGSVIITLTTNHPQGGLQFYVSERGFLERFAINAVGEVLLRRALDYEDTTRYSYQVMVTDGNTNDTASLDISVLNENEWEPRFRHAQYEFSVAAVSARGPTRVGRLEAHDGDRGDALTMRLRGPDAHLFYINDVGELFLREEAAGALNSTTVDMVATAQDSGVPPREASVPVSVRVTAPGWGSDAGGDVAGAGGRALLAGCGAALALLAALVLALSAYICRHKRNKTSSATPSKRAAGAEKAGELHNNNNSHSSGGGGGGGAEGGTLAAGGGGGSLLSVSAGASTILAASNSSLDLRDRTLEMPAPIHNGNGRSHQVSRFPAKTKIAPLPPVSPLGSMAGAAAAAAAAGGAGGAGAGLALMSDHVGGAGGAGGRSGVAWPSATIPARVKKLSWDDAETDKGGGESLTAVHDATNPALNDHMNLTVYF